MSHLQYYSYAGVGERNRKNFKYSQAVRVGDRVECAGQGGWDPATGICPANIIDQIAQAFANVELCLQTVDSSLGWKNVFRVTSYHVPIDDEAVQAMVANFRKWVPDHEPIWTCVGVPRLGEEEMKVEIEVVAHDPGFAAREAARITTV